MSTSAALVLGAGVGAVVVAPLIGVVAVLFADQVCNWHWRRQGLGVWSQRWKP